MHQQKDLADMANAITDSTLYKVLGTADESGQPWISSPEAKHSRNMAKRSHINIVIFNSQVPVGGAQAVYMSAAARELIGSDFERGLIVYTGRFPDPAQHSVRDTRIEEVRPPGLYRLYRAVALEHWVLDRYGSPDRRTPVTL